MKPNPEKGIECYAGADFAGRWNQDEGTDLDLILYKKDYIITYANCPIIWESGIQTEIALITMEA